MNALIRKNCLLWEKTALATAYYLNPAIVRCGSKDQLRSLADRFNMRRQEYVGAGDEAVTWRRRTLPITYGRHAVAL